MSWVVTVVTVVAVVVVGRYWQWWWVRMGGYVIVIARWVDAVVPPVA